MIPLTLAGLLTFVIYLLIAGLIIYAIYWFIGILSIPQPIKNIILVIIGIIALIWLLNVLFGLNIGIQ